MTYHVTALVGEVQFLSSISKASRFRLLVEMPNSLALLPLSDETTNDGLLPSTPSEWPGFQYLSSAFFEELKTLSLSGKFVYFEAEYWAGMGGQGAAVFDHGDLIYGPVHTSGIGPISLALQAFGVRKPPEFFDEFEYVGLGRFRKTEDWLRVAR